MNNPSIFLTDYASYNNGTQFQFGHWVDLTDFNDADELGEYIIQHFKEADEKSPLYGSAREETMITDYENFPSEFYSESGMNYEMLYEWIDMDEHDRLKFAAALYIYSDIEEAFDMYEETQVHAYNWSNNDKYDLFENKYPNIEDLQRLNNFLYIDYDKFIKEEFTEFKYNGETYLIED